MLSFNNKFALRSRRRERASKEDWRASATMEENQSVMSQKPGENSWWRRKRCTHNIWRTATTQQQQQQNPKWYKQQKDKWSVSRSGMPKSWGPGGRQPTRLLCLWDFLLLWDFPGKDTGVGCHFLLQGIFPTQGSNPGLLHCRQILYRLSYKGSLTNRGFE